MKGLPDTGTTHLTFPIFLELNATVKVGLAMAADRTSESCILANDFDLPTTRYKLICEAGQSIAVFGDDHRYIN